MGRKPAILLVVAVGLLANVLVITSKLIGSTTAQVGLLCMWMACNSLSQPLIIVFATNMYLVDLVGHEQRTSALSTLWGWSTLGSALSFVVGGSITAQFKDELPVYYVTGTIWIALFAYITLFIPESYPKHKRNALRREPGAVDSSSWIQQHILPIFEPLSLLKPVCDPETGQREWRLAICALHAFCVDLGGAYGATALIVYLTGVQRYTPQETGYALTTLNLVGFTVLTVIIPSLIPRLRRLYGPRDDHSLAQTRDCVDILVVFLSWVMDAAAFIFLALAESRIAQMTAVTLIGLSAGRHPVFRSLAVSGVNPLKQGKYVHAPGDTTVTSWQVRHWRP
ncbi:unnamed protein product [Mycena citricolor]|uniref:MFS general substrate transporter n=1 Tax=Mycena citricolor TaxID=2018698 RepID=A0AAD2GW92_9AGAR|nr:unnamed protein product [Mycena citricolor]